ncbi:MAG: ATP-binding protein [Desulfobacterales bacterium]|nr:ATP-binding protein [Desulfobacterales bacterium]
MAEENHGNEVCEADVSPSLSSRDMTAILSQSPVGICITKDRTLLWANPAFYDMIGHDMGSLAGKNVRILYPTEKEYRRVGNYIAAGVESCGKAVLDTRFYKKDGTAFDCRIRATLMDEGEPDRRLLVMVSDITDILSLQTQAQQAQKMEAIGVLAGGISHDFNNLLMGIQGHLSLMRINAPDSERMDTHIQQIGMLVETAADLTSRLLGFARGGKYQTSVLDINQVVSMALHIFKPTRKDIIIKEEFASSPLSVDGDHSQLEQVFLNLLVNASQAMVDAGTMTVKTRAVEIAGDHNFHFEVLPGPYVEIAIQDTGIGMDELMQKKIFEPFFSTKEAGDKKGRGLGLSTVFGIVKNHGGFITVESQKGEGATFRVSLPASDKSLPTSENLASSSLDLMPKGSETILLVDDEEEILNVGKNFLEKLGYKPMLARNGLEAVEIFKLYRDEIALVVLDLIMPVMDGKQAFTEIRNTGADIKVLVATGFTVDEEVEALLNQGCHGFIQKPFSMTRFSRAIREILDRSSC